MWELIVGGAVAASGWVAAFIARGQTLSARASASQASDRASLADSRRLTAEARVAAAEARQSRVEVDLEGARVALLSAAADREKLLEQLAKLGAPVGADLVDSSIARLYPNRDRPVSTGGDSGGGGGKAPVPAGPATAPAGPVKGGR